VNCQSYHSAEAGIILKVTFLLLLLSTPIQVRAQEGVVLRGRITDISSSKALGGASVQELGSGRGTVSDESGGFSLTLDPGDARIRISYMGYRQVDTLLSLQGSTTLNVGLQPVSIEYEEVRVTAEAGRDYVSSVRMSDIHLQQEEISALPAILGESDPVRFLQLTPGVQSSTEGGIGFFVRGGGVDQNLVLFDNSNIYNPGHLLGFLSVFNPDIIRDVSLIKSGIPARYGGRLSSVVRVNPDRGRSDSLRVKGQIGLVASRLSLNRSFNKNKGSFLFSGRAASADLFIKPAVTSLIRDPSPYFQESSYHFYDFTAGISHWIGRKDYLSFSAYYGKDKYRITRSSVRGESDINWGNALVTGRWSHLFSDRISLVSSISHTAYDFDLAGGQSDYLFGIISSVRDYTLKSQINAGFDRHRLTAGIDLTRHAFTPNEIEVSAGGLAMDFPGFNRLYAYEGGIFAEDEIDPEGPLSLALGLRYSFFNHVGPYQEYIYDESSLIRDSIEYPAGESLARYHHLEPRISLKYQLNKISSLKASFMHMAQYVHLATSATVSLPTDIWLPSSRSIQPQYGEQFSLGYFRKFIGGSFDASVEAYYKSSRNQLEFIRGIINNSLNMTLEENIAVGDGRSYGAEVFIRRNTGRLTGWAGYTVSRTERQFERINEGKIYPAKFDRRHDLSLAAIYHIGGFWNISAVFIYVSGNAFTLPVGRYIIQGNLVNEYGEVNNFRMPAYHRLDLSATRTRITRRGNVSSWNFSIYNAYNRANPFFLYFEVTGDLDEYRLEIEPKMVSLFPVIPSISWRFEF
jgi:hypothetical protein